MKPVSVDLRLKIRLPFLEEWGVLSASVLWNLQVSSVDSIFYQIFFIRLSVIMDYKHGKLQVILFKYIFDNHRVFTQNKCVVSFRLCCAFFNEILF